MALDLTEGAIDHFQILFLKSHKLSGQKPSKDISTRHG